MNDRAKDVMITIGFCGILSLAMTMGYIFISAYAHDMSVTIYINKFGEAFPELLLILMFTFAAFWHATYTLSLALIGAHHEHTQPRV